MKYQKVLEMKFLNRLGRKFPKVFILFILLIALSLKIYAVTCDYKDEPFIEVLDEKIEWVCKTDEEFCLSYVQFEERLLQVNPFPEEVEGIGMIDKFAVNDGMVKVHFTKKNLRHNTNFTFGVKCGDETLEATINPQYRDLYEVQDQMVRAKDRTKFIVLGFFIVFILIIIIAFVIRLLKRRR